MHYLSLIYFVNQPLQVSGMLLPIIRRYSLYMNSNWYVLYVRLTGSWLGQDGAQHARSAKH
jgi:cell division inhibitor SulA